MRKLVILLSLILLASFCYFEFATSRLTVKSQTPQEVLPVAQEDIGRKTLDEKLQKKLSGKKLKLDNDGLSDDLLEMSKVIGLSDGQFLIGLNHTLYKLDKNFEIVWDYKPSWILWDFDAVETTGLVYGSAGDNCMFILELSTGKKLFSNGRIGAAAYGQVKAYGGDMCLITDNNAGYRNKDDPPLDIPPLPDAITAWRGTEALWTKEFPPDADLVINGNRILAVTKTKQGIFVKEIQ